MTIESTPEMNWIIAVLVRIEKGERQASQLGERVPHDGVGRAEGNQLAGARAEPLQERPDGIQPRNERQQRHKGALPAIAALGKQIDRVADIARRQQQADVADKHGDKHEEKRFLTFAHISQQARHGIVFHCSAPPLICCDAQISR